MLTYLHGDHLGSASLATDVSGAKVSEQRYLPYGGTRSGEMPTDRQYTGQRWESSLGFYDYVARQFDPTLGRFLQADTIVPDPANPQSLNRYSYTLGNPLRYTDPSGHWGKDIHYDQTWFWVNNVALQVTEFGGQLCYDDVRTWGELIAGANLDVDIREAIIPGVGDTIAGRSRSQGEWQVQQPSAALGGAVPEQYYHYPSKVQATVRLEAAIAAQDPLAFGRALHSYQDYYAHTLSGFTALPGDIASLFSNCAQCLAQSDAGANLGRLLAQAARTGHDGVSWPDAYDPTSKRAIDMQSGTLWYTIRFLTTYYGVDYDQFMQANPDLISNWDFLQ